MPQEEALLQPKPGASGLTQLPPAPGTMGGGRRVVLRMTEVRRIIEHRMCVYQGCVTVCPICNAWLI